MATLIINHLDGTLKSSETLAEREAIWKAMRAESPDHIVEVWSDDCVLQYRDDPRQKSDPALDIQPMFEDEYTEFLSEAYHDHNGEIRYRGVPVRRRQWRLKPL